MGIVGMAVRLPGRPLTVEIHGGTGVAHRWGAPCRCDPWVRGWVDGAWWWLHVGAPGLVDDEERDATPVRGRP